MAIDKIEWHSGSDSFPKNVPYENGGNHIGYFMEYLYKHNFLPDNSNEQYDIYDINEYIKVKNGEISGLEFLIKNCDEKFCDLDTNEEGLKFTNYIYDYYCYKIENILGHSSYECNYSNDDYRKVEEWLDKQFSIWETNGKPLIKQTTQKESSLKVFFSKLFKK